MKKTNSANIDDYMATFPEDIRIILENIRETVRKAAPDAEETIKYDMPTYVLDGNLVYFAAFKQHIGFYGAPTGDPAFEKALSGYKTGKGSVQFPYTQPIPMDLITKIVKYRIRQNKEKAKAKQK